MAQTSLAPGSPPVGSQPESDGTAALKEVVSSQTFGRAPTLRHLLEYLWEHREEEISEYAIGTEALRRRPDFDPRSDATVRVLVSRLRQRLKDFYETEGASLTNRIVIPVGTYSTKLVQVEAPSETTPPAFPQGSGGVESIWKAPIRNSVLLAQFAIILVLSVSVAWLIRQRNSERKEHSQTEVPHIPAFWSQFFGNGRNTSVIVPTPTFFTWRSSLLARDVHVNDFRELKGSEFLGGLTRSFGEPTLAQQYVASYDALGAFKLTRYLATEGLRANLSTTAQASLEALNKENVILEGNGHTLDSFSLILQHLSFQMQQNEWRVVDLQSDAGHPIYYEHLRESSSRVISPGIIASIPGAAPGTHVLVLLSNSQTSALVDYLISDTGIKELERAQAEHGNCQYFEAVVMLEVDGSSALTGKIAVFRPYVSQPHSTNPGVQ